MKFHCECNYKWEEKTRPECCPQCGSFYFKNIPNGVITTFGLSLLVFLFLLACFSYIFGIGDVKSYVIPVIVGLATFIAKIYWNIRYIIFLRKIKQKKSMNLSDIPSEDSAAGNTPSEDVVDKRPQNISADQSPTSAEAVQYNNPHMIGAMFMFPIGLFLACACLILVIENFREYDIKTFLIIFLIFMPTGFSFLLLSESYFINAFLPYKHSFDSNFLSFEVNCGYRKKKITKKWSEISGIEFEEKITKLFYIIPIGCRCKVKVKTDSWRTSKSFLIYYADYSSEGYVFMKKLEKQFKLQLSLNNTFVPTEKNDQKLTPGEKMTALTCLVVIMLIIILLAGTFIISLY